VKVAKIDPNKLTLVLATPSLKGARLASGLKFAPWVQGLEDLGVELRVAQLLRDRAIRITWPWVQPHVGRPLLERLDPVT
jgi:hypothetical protein